MLCYVIVPWARRVCPTNGISIGSVVLQDSRRDQHTDRQTDHATPPVAVDRNCAVRAMRPKVVQTRNGFRIFEPEKVGVTYRRRQGHCRSCTSVKRCSQL